jgi:hypothetical protein
LPTHTDAATAHDHAWKVAAGLAAAVGAAVARNLAGRGWRAATGREPPRNPASSDTTWRDALVWAGVLGLAAGLARTLARRGAAEAWRYVDGSYPAELRRAR